MFYTQICEFYIHTYTRHAALIFYPTAIVSYMMYDFAGTDILSIIICGKLR